MKTGDPNSNTALNESALARKARQCVQKLQQLETNSQAAGTVNIYECMKTCIDLSDLIVGVMSLQDMVYADMTPAQRQSMPQDACRIKHANVQKRKLIGDKIKRLTGRATIGPVSWSSSRN